MGAAAGQLLSPLISFPLSGRSEAGEGWKASEQRLCLPANLSVPVYLHGDQRRRSSADHPSLAEGIGSILVDNSSVTNLGQCVYQECGDLSCLKRRIGTRVTATPRSVPRIEHRMAAASMKMCG